MQFIYRQQSCLAKPNSEAKASQKWKNILNPNGNVLPMAVLSNTIQGWIDINTKPLLYLKEVCPATMDTWVAKAEAVGT